MLRPTALLRHIARLAVLLPFTAACGTSGVAEGDASSEAGAGDGGTEGGGDTTPPTVISNYPLAAEMRGATTATLSVTFTSSLGPRPGDSM